MITDLKESQKTIELTLDKTNNPLNPDTYIVIYRKNNDIKIEISDRQNKIEIDSTIEYIRDFINQLNDIIS